MGFHTDFCEFRELRIFENFKKKIIFIGSRSCPNQTKLGMEYHPCNDSVMQKKWYTLSERNLVFHTEIFAFREKEILKKVLFLSGKELSKSNQAQYGVSPM